MNNRKSFLKGAFCGALAILLITGIVSCGLRPGRISVAGEKTVTSDVERKLSILNSLIDESYLGDIDKKKLEEGLYEGYIGGLDDPYSVYYDEEETKAFMEATEGEYSGIGAVMTQSKDSGIIVLTHVYQDSPAMKAGLKDEDILYKVEGKEVTGEDLTDVVSRIRGEKGTKVELTVLRGKKNEEVTVVAVRDTIETQTVQTKMLEGDIGYMAVSEFDSVTYDQYVKGLDTLEGQGMKGLVVDLRGNPGGNLNTVCDILDLMLPKGLIVYTQDKNGEKREMTSDEENKFTRPMVVLVNGNSASASEIYAGAIQDYGLGKIVGTQTYGKGVVQQIFDLKDGTCVKLTIAEYYTPKGRNINGKGITPDVEEEYDLNEKNPEADNQLERAVEELKKEL
ncbi:C-terminal processing peptidase [Lachnospiraceae bacterium MD308]|nr:C-terminal processing peptidase [Lachnospiraceae bacterium MD308]MCI8502378.1 S41 family peptidase [Dorea sp.]